MMSVFVKLILHQTYFRYKIKKWNLPFNIAIVSNLFKTVIIEGVYIMVVRGGGGWLLGGKNAPPAASCYAGVKMEIHNMHPWIIV